VVCWRVKTTAEFSQCFQLERFPFDSQDVVITLRSGWEDGVELVENLSPKWCSGIFMQKTASTSEFDVSKVLLTVPGEIDPSLSATYRRYPKIDIKLHICRKPHYWISNIVVPTALFVAVGISACKFCMLSPKIAAPCRSYDHVSRGFPLMVNLTHLLRCSLHWILTLVMPNLCASQTPLSTSVALSRSASPDRLTLVVTVLLILVAYKLVVVGRLPSISYLTDIDRYLFASLTVTVGIFFWNVRTRGWHNT
jgi:hypothetical protein